MGRQATEPTPDDCTQNRIFRFFGCPTATKKLVVASPVLIYVTDSHVSKLGDLLTLC